MTIAAPSRPRLLRPAIRGSVSFFLLAAVLAIVVQQSDVSAITDALSDLPVGVALLALASLAGGALLASVRVKPVADDFGYLLPWRDALAALGIGALARAGFFQHPGQPTPPGAYL